MRIICHINQSRLAARQQDTRQTMNTYYLELSPARA